MILHSSIVTGTVNVITYSDDPPPDPNRIHDRNKNPTCNVKKGFNHSIVFKNDYLG